MDERGLSRQQEKDVSVTSSAYLNRRDNSLTIRRCLQAKLKGAQEEIAVLSRSLAEAEQGREQLAATVTLQAVEPWARKLEGKWRAFRVVHLHT